MGLTSAYWIVQKHHGYIGAEPREPRGTRFSVYLPALPERRARDTAAAAATETPGARLLVMDDEPVIRQFLERVLRHFGYDVVAVEEGRTAVAAYRAAFEAGHPFALVVLDLTVPNGMGGQQTMQELRALDPDVRAIVSSGYSNDPAMAQYREHGFCATVAKPYRVEELRAKLIEWLPAERSKRP